MGVVEVMGGALGHRSREGEKKMGMGVGKERGERTGGEKERAR